MDYTILKNEITNDPLGRGYASMSDAQVAASLNTVDRTVPDSTRYTMRRVMEVMTDAGAAITKLDQVTDPLVVEAMRALRSYTEGGGLDFSHPKTIGMIDQLTSQGVLTSQEASELKSIGTKPASRAEELGLERVEVGHVTSARAM